VLPGMGDAIINAGALADLRARIAQLEATLAKAARDAIHQDERYEKLEAALRKYGEHSSQCNRLGVINGDCYCGFAHTLDSLGSEMETETKP
jgi:hypothetical protein